MLLSRKHARRGATLVESALVYPVVFLVMLGIILLGTAVFRYQQVAHIAREASRWASVHGGKYSKEGIPAITSVPAATPDDGLWSGGNGQCSPVYTYVIVPQAAGMKLENISYSVTWTTSNTQTHAMYYDPATGTTSATPNSGSSTEKVISVSNTVTVTVTYTWNTGLFGTIPVSSTSTVTMQY